MMECVPFTARWGLVHAKILTGRATPGAWIPDDATLATLRSLSPRRQDRANARCEKAALEALRKAGT